VKNGQKTPRILHREVYKNEKKREIPLLKPHERRESPKIIKIKPKSTDFMKIKCSTFLDKDWP
jgi:hypothetical protein